MTLQIFVAFSLYVAYVHTLSVPQLPTRFTAIVEATIIHENKTYIMEEWYDAHTEKAKRLFYYENLIMTTYEDFSDGKDQLWQYRTTHDDTQNAIYCTLEAFSQNTNRGFGRNDQTQTGHLASPSDWFQFGSNFTETYLGNDFKVRGITAEAWTRNFTFSIQGRNDPSTIMNISYELTYYFSVQNWSWFASSQHRIPVRMDMEGERITDNGTHVTSDNFHYDFHYVQFLANNLTLNQELKFDIPDFYEQCNVTKYCNVYNTSHICKLTKGPPLPTVAKAFSATWEWNENDDWFLYAGTTGVEEIYYDYDNNRQLAILHLSPPYYDAAMHQLDLLDADGEGQKWVWYGDGIASTPMNSDDEIQNCFMTGFSSNDTFWDYMIPVSNRHIVRPSRFMIFNDADDKGISQEIWMGYTNIRGISAQKWKANFNIVVNAGEGSLWYVGNHLAQNQRIVLNGSVYWYFSYNWTFMYAPDEKEIPLATTYIGTVTLYNYSDILNDYIQVSTMLLDTTGHVVNWVSGTPDESYFKPPTYWRKYCSIDEEYCNKGEGHEDHVDEDVCDRGMDLPTLPKHKYFGVLEGNDIENKTSHILKIWWDYDNNEVRSEYYSGDNIIVTYDDFNQDRQWTWMHKHDDIDNIIFCNVKSYKEAVKNTSYSFENVDIGHVKTAADLWRFGEEYNVTYLGAGFNIRGIDSRSWHGKYNTTVLYNGYETNLNYESIFYFADNKTWNYYKGIEASNVPILLTFKGTWQNAANNNQSGNFNIEYHLSSFFSGPNAFDTSEMEFIFKDWYSECDVTEYCTIYPTNKLCSDSKGPSMPILPTQFYAVMEQTFESTDGIYSGTWYLEEWYDYIENRVHIIWHNGSNWKGDTWHQLDMLNSDQKWVWSGDGNDDDNDGDEIAQCQLTPTITNFTGLDVFVTETNGHISKPSTWLRWNDSKHSTVPIWNGYTRFRGIPAAKWSAFWSEYDEIPESPFQPTFAIQYDAYTTYYWSNSSWNMVVSGWDYSIPLGIKVYGSYVLYNYSESTKKYDILWSKNNFTSTYNYVVFNTGQQDDDYFEIPLQWKQCNITLYCNKYPDKEPCTGKVTRDSEKENNNGINNGLSVGYIVLMIVLFVVGLLIGVIVDRCLIKKKANKQGFQGFQQTATSDKQIDSTL